MKIISNDYNESSSLEKSDKRKNIIQNKNDETNILYIDKLNKKKTIFQQKESEKHFFNMHVFTQEVQKQSAIVNKIKTENFLSYKMDKKISDDGYKKKLFDNLDREEKIIAKSIIKDIKSLGNLLKKIKDAALTNEKNEKIDDNKIKKIESNIQQNNINIKKENIQNDIAIYDNDRYQTNIENLQDIESIRKSLENLQKKNRRQIHIAKNNKESPLFSLLQKKKKLVKKINNIISIKSKSSFLRKSVMQLFLLRKRNYQDIEVDLLEQGEIKDTKNISKVAFFTYKEYTPVYDFKIVGSGNKKEKENKLLTEINNGFVDKKDKKTKIVYEHNPEYLGTLYWVRFGIIDSMEIYNIASPENILPVEHGEKREQIKKKNAEEYMKKFNEEVGFYQKLEKSLKLEGIRNPIILVSGEPKIMTDEKFIDKEYLEIVPYEKRLYCEQLGGSRLYIAQKYGWFVPAIICDWTGYFSGYKTLWSVDEINQFFCEKTEIYFTSKGLKVLPPKHIHLEQEYQSSSLMSRIRKDYLNEKRKNNELM